MLFTVEPWYILVNTEQTGKLLSWSSLMLTGSWPVVHRGTWTNYDQSVPDGGDPKLELIGISHGLMD